MLLPNLEYLDISSNKLQSYNLLYLSGSGKLLTLYCWNNPLKDDEKILLKLAQVLPDTIQEVNYKGGNNTTKVKSIMEEAKKKDNFSAQET